MARVAKLDPRSQHGSLAYDDLQERDGDLADIGSAREDLIGAPADVSALIHRLSATRAHSRLEGATTTRKKKTREKTYSHIVHFRQPDSKLAASASRALRCVGHTDQEL